MVNSLSSNTSPKSIALILAIFSCQKENTDGIPAYIKIDKSSEQVVGITNM